MYFKRRGPNGLDNAMCFVLSAVGACHAAACAWFGRWPCTWSQCGGCCGDNDVGHARKMGERRRTHILRHAYRFQMRSFHCALCCCRCKHQHWPYRQEPLFCFACACFQLQKNASAVRMVFRRMYGGACRHGCASIWVKGPVMPPPAYHHHQCSVSKCSHPCMLVLQSSGAGG